MQTPTQGLHHVTSIAGEAAANDAFYTATLGLRRVKKTVNFDAPQMYHLYYGDGTGTPGTVFTSFPVPRARPRRPGTGETAETAFAVPAGSLAQWRARLESEGCAGVTQAERFGEARLAFAGPDGEDLALVERDDPRAPWTGGGVAAGMAIRGLHSVTLRLADADATAGLLERLGYRRAASDGAVTRFKSVGAATAHIVDVAAREGPAAQEGRGAIHHIAFAVATQAEQDRAREALAAEGYDVTPVIDRDYFRSIYFRSPGGVLFEIATAEPGFARDEPPDRLGEALMLPEKHAHLRERLERTLPPLSA